jgi:L-fuconolactonase
MAKPEIRKSNFEPWAERIYRLADSANVWAKLSGLITEAEWRKWRVEDFRPYLVVVLEAFGPDRLMFGSDWPVCLLAGSYRQVTSLVSHYTDGLAKEKQAAIFAGNAIDFYKLKDQDRGSRITQ